MPRGDGTGPGGMGPMTGRGAGYCAGYQAPGFANPGGGRGFGGRSGGFGRGWRNGFYATGMNGWQRTGGWMPYGPAPAAVPPVQPPAPAQETAALKNQIQYMEAELKAARERMAQLEKPETPDEE